MPALLLLGFEMDWVRVMTVSVLGAILGILMMIPLRRAFIVKQHGKLVYPEGTACAEVLVAGEKGGATAKMVFVGFFVALAYKFMTGAAKLWSSEPAHNLYSKDDVTGEKTGINGAEMRGELAPELLGVGYLIGPRIACLMMAGAVLSYFVLGPAIATFGANAAEPIAPAKWDEDKPKDAHNPGLIRNMEPDDIRGKYLKLIGAGAVAAGGIISMFRALPLIFGSITAGLRDMRASRQAGATAAIRTERDMPMTVVLWGSVALVVALAAVPSLGLGLNLQGILGAVMILLFGFLFVTVSSRLTGEVGSSSNPISGMTIATLLLVCSIFFILHRTGAPAFLTALTVAAVVCIASSNGGTTSQDLKTGYLVGATPYKQQWSILIGAVSSALVIGGTMLALDAVGTHYTAKGFPRDAVITVDPNAPPPPMERPGRPYNGDDPKFQDPNMYRVVHIREDEHDRLPPGRYLIDKDGHPVYRTDMPISRQSKVMDNDVEAPKEFTAPQPGLFANIIKGILGGKLQWALILIGIMIAIALELCGVSALPVAVGMYLSLGSSVPIFIGGMVRLITDKLRGKAKSDVESEMSPGVLLASGYIAGGTLCGLVIAFLSFEGLEPIKDFINLGGQIFGTKENGKLVWDPDEVGWAKLVSVGMFTLLALFMIYIGTRKDTEPEKPPASGEAAATPLM
jgi:putative OPT family oligopeptide transporter